MSFLSPWVFALGAAAALAAVALHLLSTRRPPAAPLPTARFVPESEARAVARTSRPADLPLLLLRVLALLLVGAAFARPVPDAPGPAVRAVVLLDRSAHVADPAAAAREAVTRVGDGGALVVFDTSAVAMDVGTLAVTEFEAAPRQAPGILSAALVAGLREARRVARGADSVRLAIVSSFPASAFDAATAPLRAAWPGAVEVVRVAGVTDSASGPPAGLRSPLDDDPLAPALARAKAARGAHAIRVLREAPTAADSAWAREGERLLVHWPFADDAPPAADAVTGFGLREATIVAPLARLPLATPTGARVLARWRDGAPAAAEQRLGAGCVRAVAIGVPRAGDLTLRRPFAELLDVLLEPCGGARGPAAAPAMLEALAGTGGAAPAPALVAEGAADPALAAWLLAGALLALGLEALLRRRRTA